MEVRAKKALGQHFLTDQSIARAIVDALQPDAASVPMPVLEIGPDMACCPNTCWNGPIST